MNKIHILWAVLGVLSLTSCFKDEALNAECDVNKAWLHADDPLELFYQASDSLVEVLSDNSDIRFSVKRKADLTALAPLFDITPGATISPANGSVHDFSNQAVIYRVTSQDGTWHRDYSVSVVPVIHTEATTLCYDFENNHLDDKGKYYIWSDEEDGIATDIWATGNGGFGLASSSAKPDEYPSIPLSNGFDGKAVRLVTRETGKLAQAMKMRIAAGNLFNGSFSVSDALKKPLEATKFGRPFDKLPKQFSGYYRYTPGDKFQNKDGSIVDGKVDVPSVYAVMYRNHDASGNAVTLNGANVLTSPLIVGRAVVTDLAPTTEWREFKIDFTYNEEIDIDLLNNRGYNLAIVFSSSADGAYFQGAIGSTLDIDKVRIECEEQE